MILDYLTKEPGRHSVDFHTGDWDTSDFIHEKICFGTPQNGYKVNICPVPFGADIGIGYPGKRLTITNDPFCTLNGVVVADELTFPKVELINSMNVLFAIKHHPVVTIACENRAQYHAVHDQLSMLNIEHSLQSEEDVKNVHLTTNLVSAPGRTLVLYGVLAISVLMKAHSSGKIVIIGERSPFISPYSALNSVLSVISEMSHSAVSMTYLSFQTLMSPAILKQALFMLRLMGCVKKVDVDEGRVVIQKKGEFPNDIEFHTIPEGTFTVRKLMSVLKVNREGVFPLLKKYENRGLIFAYNPAPGQTLYAIGDKVLEPQRYEAYTDAWRHNLSMLNDLERSGAEFLNRHLERCIEKHGGGYIYRGNNVREINPKGTSLSLPASFQEAP